MTRTLLAVHAHPDDESTSTGGILAHYASLGTRIVLVTCTNGELGDAPDGAKPFTPAHDPARVAAHRLGELQAACRVLGVTDVELLGYHDSGIPAWKKPHGAFVDVPVPEAADQVARLIEHYEPQVVVTYDAENTAQHRDHLHAAQVASAAFDLSGVATKLYFKAHVRAHWERLVRVAASVGIHRDVPPDSMASTRASPRPSTPRAVVDRKRAALHCHASQLGSSIAGRLPAAEFAEVFGVEDYIRARDTTGCPVPETDLFSGLGPC
ncbi:PIG-L deacetylase family protein [Lentzea jiangxiensis]|uniref:N-acetylglucosaminyl deacetylase, LmbE family n=1 Tax=Lentzea jiangxiensis TaxID=641025 RepID=A0A1H0KR54_9PSEU|nr:PIG-L family deacetylase [Lentzea jiangxiensis]SDO58448.1 N-acetylglucosaminyl deacetylase, LmbE family [Lentzea jiangxiensis]